MKRATTPTPRPKNDPVDPVKSARPSGEPQQTYVVNSSGEVRAGPGDAGRQDVPRVLDNPQDKPDKQAQGRGMFISALLAGLAFVILLWLLAL